MKYDANGNQIWVARYDGPGQSGDNAWAIALDGAGNVYITGDSASGPNFANPDYATIKYVQSEVPRLPTITEPPHSQGAFVASDVTFTVTASGSAPLSFQWRLDARAIPGATNATLVLTNIQLAQAGDYSVEVSNSVGTTVSPEARLTVCPRLRITAALSQSVASGSDVIFGVGTYDELRYEWWAAREASYRWQFNGTNLLGATNATLRLTNVQPDSAGEYTVVASCCEVVTSVVAKLTVLPQLQQAWVVRHALYNGSDDRPSALAVDGVGNGYVTGSSGTLKYDSNGNQLWLAPSYAGRALALDTAGNVYLTGFGTTGPLIAKLDVNGNQQWVYAETNRSSPASLVLDRGGNAIVTGNARDPSSGNGALVIVKYAANGSRLWTARIIGGRSTKSAVPVAVDAAGNVYVAGTPCDDLDCVNENGHMVAKYDADGNRLWLRSGLGAAVALALDSSGNIYVAGTSVRVPYIDFDYALVKYDPDGNQIWVADYDGPHHRQDEARSLAVDHLGNAYVTGSSYVTNDYGRPNMVTVKFDAQGNQLWVARYNGPANSGDAGDAIALDSAGNVYVTGVSDGDYVTLKYDPSGNQLWRANYNGPANSYDSARALALDAAGNIYVTGCSFDTNGWCDYATLKYVQIEVAGLPLIAIQPQRQCTSPGKDIAFTATASGAEPLAYQWRFNGIDLAGATNGALVLTNVQLAQAGGYSVQIRNGLGATASPEVLLSVGGPPAITIQPASRSVFSGATVAFDVRANGVTPFYYQWRFNGMDMPGARNSTLRLTNVQPPQAGNYSAVVENCAGSATSAVATLTVRLEPPAIVSQPPGQTVVVGSNVTFGVAATTGSLPLSYQWQFNGTDVGGATNASLVLTNLQYAHEGDYLLVVTNQFGSVTSAVARLSVVPLLISYQPGDRTQLVGEEAIFGVGVRSSVLVGYQWRFNGADIPGATNGSLRLANVQFSHAGDYTVVVTNVFGSVTSRVARLTVVPLFITAQPASRLVLAGESATFVVWASGPEPLNYQWQANATNLSGETNFALTLTNVQPAQAADYRVIVANSFGAVTSAVARLTVDPLHVSISPYSQTVKLGSNATFSATAQSTVPVRYQWQFNGTDLLGATNATLTLTNVQQANVGDYTVIGHNSFGSVTSAVAKLLLGSFAPARLSVRGAPSSEGFEITGTGGIGRTYRLQATSSLPTTNWQDIAQFTLSRLTTNLLDSTATNFSQRFYRAVSP